MKIADPLSIKPAVWKNYFDKEIKLALPVHSNKAGLYGWYIAYLI